MISLQNNIFHLFTKNTSYVFRILKTGHAEHLYYGAKLNQLPLDITALFGKYSINNNRYDLAIDKNNEDILLNSMPLEFSSEGKGDFKTPLISALNKKTLDFRYKGHVAKKGISRIKASLFQAIASEEDATSLEVEFEDKNEGLTLTLVYSVFFESDTITRRIIVRNKSKEKIILKNAFSLQLDFLTSDFTLTTLSASVSSERNEIKRELNYGKTIIESRNNLSSLNHNPALILESKNSNDCYLINLVYSGSHQEVIEVDSLGHTHILTGINPDLVNFTLEKDGEFESAEAVLSFSDKGLDELSNRSHFFINNHILRGVWKNKLRPVINHTKRSLGKNFTEKQVQKAIIDSASLGFDLFCLSDGWFGVRNDDLSSLGDWSVNTDKLPSGLRDLAIQCHTKGMLFGLWFEVECISENSRLYKQNPSWILKGKKRESAYGHSQYILDLTREDVQDYVISVIRHAHEDFKVDYIKWDFNRLFSDIITEKGEDYLYRYITSLNKVLKTISITSPKLLIEMGAFGGARLDLGLLCYSQFLTLADSYNIKSLATNLAATSLVYPSNVIGTTISDNEKVRRTGLESAFNMLSNSCLSYDVNIAELSFEEKEIIKNQIAFYKQYRAVFQFGRLSRVKTNKGITLSKDAGDGSLIISTIADFFDSHTEILKIKSARDSNIYDIHRREETSLDLKTKNGEYYQATGSNLKNYGIRLINEINTLSPYEKDLILSDFEARQYIAKKG